MQCSIWEDWLVTFAEYRSKTAPGCRTLLLVDNAPVHSLPDHVKAILDTHRVRVEFLPPNMTSAVQPMDQGIIRSVKAKYRARMLPHILTIRNRARPEGMSDKEYEAHRDPNKVTNFGVLEVCNFLVESWNDVTAVTIQRCFRKAGIMTEEHLASMPLATSRPDVSRGAAAVGQALIDVASQSADVEEVDGVLIQGFKEVIEKLELLQELDRRELGGERVPRDVLAEEVVRWLRDGHTDNVTQSGLLTQAFVDNCESVCWDVTTVEHMKVAFKESLTAAANSNQGGDAEDDGEGASGVDLLTQRAAKEARLRELLPMLKEAGDLCAELTGDRKISTGYLILDAALNG